MKLSDAKSIIRAAREAVAHPGAVGGESPWVGWLVESDWFHCADYEVGGVDEQGWAGMWVLDHTDLNSPHRLFRELRDPAVTCVVVTQSVQGFIGGYVSGESRDVVEAELDDDYGLRCSECGGALGDVYFEHDDMICSGCMEFNCFAVIQRGYAICGVGETKEAAWRDAGWIDEDYTIGSASGDFAVVPCTTALMIAFKNFGGDIGWTNPYGRYDLGICLESEVCNGR